MAGITQNFCLCESELKATIELVKRGVFSLLFFFYLFAMVAINSMCEINHPVSL